MTASPVSKLRAMFDLTDEQQQIQRLARDFARNEVKPVAEELDREHRLPYEINA